MWKDDDELFGLMRQRLFAAVVGDILDGLGFMRQFLQPQIQSVQSRMVVACRAMPVPETLCFDAVTEEGKSDVARMPFGVT